MPVIPALWEAEVGKSLQPSSLRPAWATKRDLISTKSFLNQVQWLTPIIPALWEAETADGLSRKFKTSLGNMVKPCPYKNYKY